MVSENSPRASVEDGPNNRDTPGMQNTPYGSRSVSVRLGSGKPLYKARHTSNDYDVVIPKPTNRNTRKERKTNRGEYEDSWDVDFYSWDSGTSDNSQLPITWKQGIRLQLIKRKDGTHGFEPCSGTDSKYPSNIQRYGAG